jgi:hypothetical protein
MFVSKLELYIDSGGNEISIADLDSLRKKISVAVRDNGFNVRNIYSDTLWELTE